MKSVNLPLKVLRTIAAQFAALARNLASPLTRTQQVSPKFPDLAQARPVGLTALERSFRRSQNLLQHGA